MKKRKLHTYKGCGGRHGYNVYVPCQNKQKNNNHIYEPGETNEKSDHNKEQNQTKEK